MDLRKRTFSEAEPHPEYGTSYGLRSKRNKTATYPQHYQPRLSGMAPPPTPIDPNLESYGAVPSSSLALDQILLTSPGPQQRSYPYPKDLGLFLQDGQASSMRPSQLDSNPSVNAQPDPWDSQRINGGAAQPQLMNHGSTGARERMFHQGPPAYWDSQTHQSDIDSSTGQNLHDSGYYTQTHGTGTVFSGDIPSTHDCQSLAGGMTEVELRQEEQQSFGNRYPQPSRDSQSDFKEQQRAGSLDLICETCQKKSNNRSDFNKHKLRHEKPFRCDVESCHRTEGFTTQNDLDRHKKSVHQIQSGKSYMCAVPHCAKKTKIWPRADNFRQHCIRLHPTWELNVLMDRSWELGTKHTHEPRKEYGSLEIMPQNNRYLAFNQSQLVNLQDLQKASHGEFSMGAYDQNSQLPPYSLDARHEDMYNDLVPQQGRECYLEPDTMLPSHQQVTMHYLHEAPSTVKNASGLQGVQPARSLSESSKLQPATLLPERSLSDPRMLSNNDREVQARVNSTSKPAVISARDFSKLAAQITDRLGLHSDGQRDNKTKEDVERAIQSSFSNLLGAKAAPRKDLRQSPPRDVADTEKSFQCTRCPKKKKTQCDLTKHHKRHTRPYGCTHTSCPRRFGSKNDWKRHENAMHWQIEAWKCAEPLRKPARAAASKNLNPAHALAWAKNKTRHQCGQVFYRREQFQAHLDDYHEYGGKDPEHVKQQCKSRRVGRNGQKGFWCGFCQTVVELKKKSLEALDERFTHIDEEHFKKGQRVEDWFPLDKELPKGILDEEKVSADDEVEKGSDEDTSGSDIEEMEEVVSIPVPSKRSVKDAQPPRSTVPEPTKPRQRIQVWFCCQCNDGPKSRLSEDLCLEDGCHHRRCGSCRNK